MAREHYPRQVFQVQDNASYHKDKDDPLVETPAGRIARPGSPDRCRIRRLESPRRGLYERIEDVWAWFADHERWWHVSNLPPYSPDMNAAECIWLHTRVTGTHSRYFATEDEIVKTLRSVFRDIRRRPEQIMGYLRPFS
jgi:hypothetical protein